MRLPISLPISLAVAPLWIALPLAAQVSDPSAADATGADAELIAVDRRLFETQILDQDPALLLSLTDDGYTVVAPGGVVESRDQVIAGLQAFTAIDSIRVEHVGVLRAGETAVVLSRLEIHGEIRGPMGALPRLSTMTVFTRGPTGDWRLVSRALSPCDPRAAERGLC